MALISCPCCSQHVSDQATVCPNCGHPLLAAAKTSAAPLGNVAAVRTSSAAIVSLIFGLLSWCALPIIGAIIAVITGHSARDEIRNAPVGSIEGDGLAIAGLVLGWVHLVLFALVLSLIFGIFGMHFFGYLHW